MLKTLTGLAAAAALVVPATAMANQSYDCSQGGTDPTQTGRTLSLTGSNTLWPPNHKYHDYIVSAASTSPLDTTVMLNSTVTSSEPDVGLGSGGPKHANDANPFTAMGSNDSGPDVSVTQALRSERSGMGSGRTYTFHVTATWNMMSSCSTTFTVFVPHDQGNH